MVNLKRKIIFGYQSVSNLIKGILGKKNIFIPSNDKILKKYQKIVIAVLLVRTG